MKNDLYLIRGLPGSGKSTLANALNGLVFEADDYWIERDFDPSLLGEAHYQCKKRAQYAMSYNAKTVVVSNTFTTEKELEPYFTIAALAGYRVTVLIVENRHGNASVHDVPEVTMLKMEKRFSVRLR